ncbi:unnamed protein product [Adineta steineri]|uniref:G-protein coupled receptors family 1 profile domain-containing protein n=1 Tax=Adineta steineri TaxID=433720 RepID=A0A820BQC0_9BILA|nr:unnamed protein product [Adineta steineri]CAF4210944.1 unnamed protein product [Adineta steineri]
METILSDWYCRILAYLGYVSLTMISYSYILQGLSRLFFIVFHKNRKFLTYKYYISLIIVEIFLSFLLFLPILITRDIVFRPLHLCLIPAKNSLHIGYFLIVAYFTPFLIIIIIYGIIYYRVIKSSIAVRHSSHLTKRELELIRNILILLFIFLLAGIPSLIYIIISSKVTLTSHGIYMFIIMTPTIASVIEKICFIYLNKDIWKEIKKFSNKMHPNRVTADNTLHSVS